VAYNSPNWSGFTVEYNHARVTENANRRHAAGTSGSVYGTDLPTQRCLRQPDRGNYTNGPFWRSMRSGREADNSNKSTLAGHVALPKKLPSGVSGADYDFGMVKIYGTYQNRDQDRHGLWRQACQQWRQVGRRRFDSGLQGRQHPADPMRDRFASDVTTAVRCRCMDHRLHP
jgi:predicted porin